MTNEQIKNLSLCFLNACIILYSLILNYTQLGLVISLICIAIMSFLAVIHDKNQGILQKIDLYIILIIIAVIGMKYTDFINFFSFEMLQSLFFENIIIRIIVLIAGVLSGIILFGISQKSPTKIEFIILRFSGFFTLNFSVAFFFFAKLSDIVIYVIIYIFFGFITYIKADFAENASYINRTTVIALICGFISVINNLFFYNYTFFKPDIRTFLTMNVLTWYNIFGISLIFLIIFGIYNFYNNDKMNIFDEDILFLSGILGFIWILKAILYFYFSFNWIIILVYTAFFMIKINKYLNTLYTKNIPKKSLKIYNNELFTTLISSFIAILLIFLIHTGYLYFSLALILGFFITFFTFRMFKNWLKDAIFWQSILFSVTLLMCSLCIQSAFHMSKIIIILSVFLLTSVVMWMMNYKNNVDQNKYKVTKIVISVIFSIIIVIPTFKNGSVVNITLTNKNANIGALITEKTDLDIIIKSVGKDNEIAEIKYVWTDNFLYDHENIKKTDENIFPLIIENDHLIIWITDKNGIITKKDCWFYGKYSSVHY